MPPSDRGSDAARDRDSPSRGRGRDRRHHGTEPGSTAPAAAGADRDPTADPTTGPDGTDVDPVLLRTFWGSVIAVNVAMAAIPLGVLLIYFRGDWELGGLALAVGAVAAAGAVRFYLIFRADRRDADDEEVPAP